MPRTPKYRANGTPAKGEKACPSPPACAPRRQAAWPPPPPMYSPLLLLPFFGQHVRQRCPRSAQGGQPKFTSPLAEASILNRPQRPGLYLQTRGQGRAHSLMWAGQQVRQRSGLRILSASGPASLTPGRAAGETRILAEMTPNERFFLGLKMAVLKTGHLPAHLLGGNLAVVGAAVKTVHLASSQPDYGFSVPPFWARLGASQMGEDMPRPACLRPRRQAARPAPVAHLFSSSSAFLLQASEQRAAGELLGYR